MTAVSRPPEGRARRVLTTSTSSTNNLRSPTLSSSTSKPIRARVDLASLASPPSSPSLHAGPATTTTTWTPTQPVKVKARSTVGVRSAPTTPTVYNAGTFRSTPTTTHAHVRPTLSPQVATTPAATIRGARAVSPQQRARSPDAATARVRTTSRVGPQQGATAAGELRGQRDPFPSSLNNNAAPTPITHLPSSVSVRRLHSPSLRASQRREHEQQQYLSTSTSSSATSSSSALPPLSSSPSSVSSSPLTSPNLHSIYDSSPATLSPRLAHSTTTTGLGFRDRTSCSSDDSNARRSSGISSASSSSFDSNSNTPIGPRGTAGLLPAFSSYSSPAPSPSMCASPPLVSSPSFSNVAPNPYALGNPLLRSPTLPTSTSTKTLRSVPTSSQSFSLDRPQPTYRTRTVTSSSNGSASVPFPPAPVASSSSHPFPATLDRAPGSVHDETEWDRSRGASRTSEGWKSGSDVAGGTSPELLSTSPSTLTTGMAANRTEVLLRESIEKEIEAKVSRRILDLEIRTSSLLSINAQLERQKLKQTSEIRDLRRKLRESIGAVGTLSRRVDDRAARSSSSSGGEFSDADEFDHDVEGDEDDEYDEDEDEKQPTWEELVEADPSFGHVASVVEALIKRGKKAVEYEVAERRDGPGGRVLSTVEMEDRLEQERAQEEREEDDETPSASDGEGSVE